MAVLRKLRHAQVLELLGNQSCKGEEILIKKIKEIGKTAPVEEEPASHCCQNEFNQGLITYHLPWDARAAPRCWIGWH